MAPLRAIDGKVTLRLLLDAASIEGLVEAVEAEREAGTIQLLVTHDAPLAERVADRHLHLDKGRLAKEEASP